MSIQKNSVALWDLSLELAGESTQNGQRYLNQHQIPCQGPSGEARSHRDMLWSRPSMLIIFAS